jgi:hypothetical protein
VAYTLRDDDGSYPICEMCFDKFVINLRSECVSGKVIDLRPRLHKHPHAVLPVVFSETSTNERSEYDTVLNDEMQYEFSFGIANERTNHMIVKVAPMGETVTEVNVEVGSTVEQILDVAGVDDNGRSITVNNAPATLDTRVETDNAVISLANKMKGGN